VKEYDIYLPLRYNDGTPVETRKFRELQQRLLEEFGGVTYFPQPNEGLWQMGDVVYQDEIVIYRVIAKKRRPARRFLLQLKEDLKSSFKQKEILIVERDVETL
jgi:hypothetical protein